MDDLFKEFGFDEEPEPEEQKIEPEPEPKPEPEPTPEPKPEPKTEPEPEPVITIQKSEKTEYDFEEEVEPKSTIVTIYSHKGHGKTDAALSFPGKICAISFDRKTKSVALKRYPNKEIHVWDGCKYYDESSPELKIQSADTDFTYLNILLDKVIRSHNPDWIVIDCTEVLHEICEMVMRYRNGLMPFQGIANRNLWKERKMYLRQIHNLATSIAKKGVIYTLYPGENDIKIVDGEIVDRTEIPKWIDIVMRETDIVIKIERMIEEGVVHVYATVESNKSTIPFKNMRVDITNKYCYDELLEEEV